MSYNNSNTQNSRKNRIKKVILFNPLYSKNVKTLVRKHFPKKNKYHKIFNLKTLKPSYCCTANVGNIKQHNSKVVSKTNGSNNRTWNYKSNPNCRFHSESLTQCLLYKATSTTSNNRFACYGTSEGKFKTRYNNHRKSFKYRECMNETGLSKHVFNLCKTCIYDSLLKR